MPRKNTEEINNVVSDTLVLAYGIEISRTWMMKASSWMEWKVVILIKARNLGSMIID